MPAPQFITHRLPRPLVLTLGLVAVPVVVFLGLVELTPILGRVVRYADAQPELRVRLLPGGASREMVGRIRALAKYHFDARPDLVEVYWPEPELIEECVDSWHVAFKTRSRVYRFLGYEQVRTPTDTAMHMTITKEDLSMRFGNWCR